MFDGRLFLTILLGACAASQASVPMVGTAGDVAALSGQWSGEYSSAASSRSGSISFTLRAAGDSATGDVVMVPTMRSRGPGRASSRHSSGS